MLHHANRAAVGITRDPFFDQTVLLLHGDGTNGAQNNTFLDSSTNNFTITRNGNTTQGTFSPFSRPDGYWSNFFDGTSDYFTVPSNTAFAFGTGDFTIEFWIYLLESKNGYNFVNVNNSAASGSVIVGTNNSAQLEYWNGATRIKDNVAVTLNSWTHVALCRNSGTSRLFKNGVQIGSNYSDTINCVSTNNLLISSRNDNLAFSVNGYISNLRIVKGTAVYTSNFTPPTAPLTAITNTSLLTCQSNRFKDNSSNAFAITRNGNVAVQVFSPLNPPAPYSTSVVGGSGYFDGTGDYLSVADNANLRFGTDAFTVQAWIYRSNIAATHSIIAKGGASTGWVLQITGVLRFTHGTTNVDTTTTIPQSVWTHVAAVRTSTGTNGFQLYINGVSAATATVATNFNQTDTLYIGADRGATNVMNGYISGVKYTNGTAETISVPTAPPTATTNVALLCAFTNAGIIDNTAVTISETVGNAQISTSIKRYGTGSLSFDGTGDWLLVADAPQLRFGTGNFTIEMFLYLNATGAACGLIAKGTSTTGWLVSLNSSNQVVFTHGTTTITSTGTISATTWTHIAVVRQGTGSNLTKIYINGTNDGTGTVSTNFNQTSVLYVGANRTAGDALNGYLDEVRVTNGIARYTAAFTPPQQPLADF